MGILEVITVVLFVLKLTLYPEWSWWIVASPLLVALTTYLTIFVLLFSRGIPVPKFRNKK